MKRKITKTNKSVKVALEKYNELLMKKELRKEQKRNRVRSWREENKRKKLIPNQILRSVCMIANVCNLISDKLDDFIPLSTLDRINKVNKMF